MLRRLVPILLALAAPAAVLAVPPASIRCGSRLVSVGDAKLDLLGRCGPPTYSDAREVERNRLRVDGARHASDVAATSEVILTVEEWTYDFGPSALVQFVTLEGGRIVWIESGGYGHLREAARPTEPLPRAPCEPAVIDVGDRKLELLLECGEPVTADRRRERRAVTTRFAHEATGESVTVEVEVWAYNFGPNRLTELVTIVDGWVVKVERGSYGY
jgi:Protein of unknown function (DUF2845)